MQYPISILQKVLSASKVKIDRHWGVFTWMLS